MRRSSHAPLGRTLEFLVPAHTNLKFNAAVCQRIPVLFVPQPSPPPLQSPPPKGARYAPLSYPSVFAQCACIVFFFWLRAGSGQVLDSFELILD